MLTKIRHITAPRVIHPQIGWVTTASMRSLGLGPLAGGAGLDDLGGDPADCVVARGDERAGPIHVLGGPAFLPTGEDLGGAGAERRGAGDAHGILVGEEEEGLGAGDEGGFCVVRDERGLDFRDGGGNGAGDVPRMARERQVGAAHGEPELDQALAADGFAGNDGHAEFLREFVGENRHARLGGEVHHVEDHDHRAPEV